MHDIYLFSTIGASIFTNEARKLSQNFNKYLNCTDNEISPADKSQIDTIFANLESRLVTENDVTTFYKSSAELNTILRYIQKRNNTNDRFAHYLIVSDSYIGKKCACLIEAILYNNPNFNKYTNYKQQLIITGLKTTSLSDFKIGLSELTKQITGAIRDIERKQIVFNLSGGFKGVLAYLNTMANLYAKESLYIFENNQELLVIPSLPVIADGDNFIKEHINILRKINIGVKYNLSSITPELRNSIYLIQLESEYLLSDYFYMVYPKVEELAYAEKLLDSPHNAIKFSNKFKQEVENLSPIEKYQINQQIDKLARYLHNNRQTNLSGLDYKELRSDNEVNGFKVTHEFDAFHNNGARRGYCTEVNGIITIETLGKHL